MEERGKTNSQGEWWVKISKQPCSRPGEFPVQTADGKLMMTGEGSQRQKWNPLICTTILRRHCPTGKEFADD